MSSTREADEGLVASLLDLVRVSSFYGDEKPLCDALEARLVARLGRARVARHGDSIVGWLCDRAVRSERPRVGLVGHLDVVRTAHSRDPRVEADRLYGPGAADMKSGLALMLDVLEMASYDALAFDVVLVFYAREEGPFADNELGPLLDAMPDVAALDLAVCLEPSDNKLQLGCMGSLHAKVTVRGRSAHSARPWQGDNAVLLAIPLLERLRALEPRDVTIDGFLFREVTSVTTAHAGRGRNVIPDAFELNVNHRFAPTTSLAVAESNLRAWIAEAAVPADVEIIDRSPAALPFAAHPLVQRLANAGVAAVEPKQAWTDVARFAALGVPAVNWGPGTQAQAHQPDEWTSVSTLVAGRDILRSFLARSP